MREARSLHLIPLAALVTLLSTAGVASARQTIVVLAFGGNADSPRDQIVSALRNRYTVLQGQALLDGCERLGIQMSRGKNLARCAAEVGAVAVIGGTEADGDLNLAVYSGKNGQPLATGTVGAADLRGALALILKGLKLAPKRVGSATAAPPAPSPAPPRPRGQPKPEKGDDLTFEPETVEKGGRGQRDDSDENPLLRKDPGATPATPDQPMLPNFNFGVAKKKKQEEPETPWPKVVGTLGFGTWMRSFSINDPYDPKRQFKPTAPGYTSGAAFALKLALKVRPAAFFTDGFASWLYARLSYGQTVGLKSKNDEKNTSTGITETISYGTVIREFLLDVGVDWKILAPSWSPHLEAGIGFALTDFTIDWAGSTTLPRPLPDTGYRSFLINLRAVWPFLPFLGAHFGVDFRIAGSSGDVEDMKDWYGPSSTGGVAFALGVSGTFKGIVATAEYTYTRYFLSFSEADARANLYDQETASGTSTTRAAGGGLDIIHGFLISLGYSY